MNDKRIVVNKDKENRPNDQIILQEIREFFASFRWRKTAREKMTNKKKKEICFCLSLFQCRKTNKKQPKFSVS